MASRRLASAPALLLIALLAQPTVFSPQAHAASPVSAHAMVYACCTPYALKERIFAEASAMGASRIRVDVEMSSVFPAGEEAGSAPDWRGLDEVMRLSSAYRLPVLGIILDTPPSMSTCPGPSAPQCAPQDPAAYGRLAGQIAAHARGVIREWEIVNEPDGQWAFLGSPEEYARMLSASYDGIKARAPEDGVALGGLMSPPDSGWLERVFRTPGADAAHKFDIANVHLRGWASGLAGRVRAARAWFARHGFTGPLWVTEHGYPAEPKYQEDPSYKGGEAAQAAFLNRSLLELLEAGAGQVFVTLRDNLDGPYASEGVVHIAAAPSYSVRRKPGFAVVRAFVDRWPRIAGWRSAQHHHEQRSLLYRGLAAACRSRAVAERRGSRTARSWMRKIARRARRAGLEARRYRARVTSGVASASDERLARRWSNRARRWKLQVRFLRAVTRQLRQSALANDARSSSLQRAALSEGRLAFGYVARIYGH
jgi:hypothetical protein